MRNRVLAGFAAVLAVCLLNVNQAEAAKGQKRLLNGTVAKQNIDKVNQGINWHTSLSTAQSEARRSGKMILWVQMIGKMDGAT